MSDPILYLGLDVHKESVTIAVLPEGAATPTQIDKIANEPKVLRRYLAHVAGGGAVRACHEASGAGYVLQRDLQAWGYACEVIAPSLIPQRPGHQRKHDRYDAAQLARLYRSGELTVIRIPTEAEERVRDLVRCRMTFQRELLRARHHVLKFLTRRGVRYTAGKCHWTQAHHRWLDQLLPSGALCDEDVVSFTAYLEQMRQVRVQRDAPPRPGRSWPSWGSSPARPRAARTSAAGPSRKRATVTAATCSSKRRGPIAIRRASVPAWRAGRRANPRP